MSEFKCGDVVQCIQDALFKKQVGTESTTSSFFELSSTPHPCYGMIGVIYNLDYPGKVMVWFPSFWAEPDEITNLPGKWAGFTPDELTKIGTTAVSFPYDKINLVAQEAGNDVLQGMNEKFGTSFNTMEEFLKHFREKGNPDSLGHD